MCSHTFSISPMEILPKQNQVWVFRLQCKKKPAHGFWNEGMGFLFVCFVYFDFNFCLYYINIYNEINWSDDLMMDYLNEDWNGTENVEDELVYTFQNAAAPATDKN